MFEVKEEVSKAEQSKWNECSTFKKVNWGFLGGFPKVAKTENKFSLHGHFIVECMSRPAQGV